MTTVEIILLIVGIVFMIGSFFVTEKLSQKEITQLSEVSSTAVKRILEKNMQQAKAEVTEQIQSVVGRKLEDAARGMERETNLKIQNISEYSGTVLEDIHKNHSEVMFLYSMLNDKHAELNNMIGRLGKLRKELEQLEEEITVMIAESAQNIRALAVSEIKPSISSSSKPVGHIAESGEFAGPGDLRNFGNLDDLEGLDDDLDDLEQELTHIGNQNQDILDLYRQNTDPREIARKLGLGVGEVKLVIDLYREGEA